MSAPDRPVSPASPRPWTPELQEQRGAHLLSLVRGVARGFFDEQGECVLDAQTRVDIDMREVPAVPFYLRERVNCVQAFLAGDPDDTAFANRILDRLELSSCDFSTLFLLLSLLRHPDRISPENQARLREHIAVEVRHVQRPHNAFVGANDNFPSMGTAIMTLGGELLGDESAVQAGLDNLYSLRDLLSRRGFLSEYNSPTYSGVTLNALGATANHARHPEARELARQAAERVWLDVALHWHPALSFPGGPYSRAYHGNSLARSALTNILVWVVMGDSVFLSPQYFAFEEPVSPVDTRPENVPFLQAGVAGYAGTVHHLPDYVAELMLQKSFPFRLRGTTESGSFHVGAYRRLPSGAVSHIPGRTADTGADSAFLSTYLEEDFALGTATRPFCGGGQTDLFHVLYKLQPGPSCWADLRAAFTRYLVNETQPGGPDSHGLLAQQGNGCAIQDDRRALVLFHPNGAQRSAVASLKLSLILQEHTSPLGEIWIGDRRLPGGDGESAQPDWVILRDGRVYLAFLPLLATDLGRDLAVTSRHQNGHRVLSFYNYSGPPRDFEAEEIRALQNGFVCEIASADDYPGVPEFLADLRAAQVSDSTVLDARGVRYLRDGRELLLWLDPVRRTIKSACVNGQEIAYPPLDAEGLDLSHAPWLTPGGLLHDSLDWWQRIAARPAIEGLEPLSGYLAED